ncbi:transcription factor PAP1-domain-containing protein [Lineolata rhizophorae]|uniref:Transcription factor PAP1-domain-containing protein n=1 Tax=Lineolata rhizophorae TaxID=578093 RepID=A0A6A6NQC5_9PEZI|nr:transcription factor PAP1-domain-containing protein [Lineolata rhizophorae]
MAGASNANSNPFDSLSYFDHKDVLAAALSSNKGRSPAAKSSSYPPPAPGKTGTSTTHPRDNVDAYSFGGNNMNQAYFASPQQGSLGANFGDFGSGVEESPFMDFIDSNDNFDFDVTEGADDMIGALPGTDPTSPDNEAGDKRKSPDDGDIGADDGNKRREGEDKQAKKPGRKPLTSEPTTKRKAQNRAAQRAFRERKEKHLKDLETKVTELQKASESANHENGLLRAQVTRLQTELREYRKRLSLNSNGAYRSPPSNASGTGNAASTLSGANNFQFEFPRFGGLPGSHIFNNSAITATSDNGSTASKPGSITGANGRSMSPKSQANGLQGQNQNGVSSSFRNVDKATRGSADSSTGQPRVFQFNSGSNSSNTDSPSASSTSQYGGGGPTSSCGTSPEPSHNSPSKMPADGNLDSVGMEGYVCHRTGSSEGEVSFCEKLNMACGNPRNPIPRALSHSNGTPAPGQGGNNNNSTNTNKNNTASSSSKPTPSIEKAKTPAAEINGIDWLANQNGGQFDPLLFGDYRESQAAIVGDGDFSGGFFNDAFPLHDFGSPLNWSDLGGGTGTTPAAAAANKVNPMEEIERLQDGIEPSGASGDEEVVPGEDTSQMLSCHKIWDKIQDRPDFKDGSFDIDSLCSELRAKARCSEAGVVVDQKDVDAALKRMPQSPRGSQSTPVMGQRA